MSLVVLRPGPLTLVQDDGRPGLAALGVTRSGAADRSALAAGAALVGNPAGAAALECLLGGLVLHLTEPAVIALTGADCPARLDDEALPHGRAVAVPPGVLSLGQATHGLRCYLSVAGGIDVPAVLGSRSRDTLAGLGPAPLRHGDVLGVGPATGSPRFADRDGAPGGDLPLRLLPGPRTDWLADPSRLASTDWQVSPRSDRVGVRLLGEPLEFAASRAGEELPSEAVVRGSVQVPPNGLPVVFGADHPTTGGYPVVAVLTAAASDHLAQRRPGQSVRLEWG